MKRYFQSKRNYELDPSFENKQLYILLAQREDRISELPFPEEDIWEVVYNLSPIIREIEDHFKIKKTRSFILNKNYRCVFDNNSLIIFYDFCPEDNKQHRLYVVGGALKKMKDELSRLEVELNA